MSMQFRVGSNVPAQRVGRKTDVLDQSLRAGITTPTEAPAVKVAAASLQNVDSPTFEAFAAALKRK